MIGVFDSGYGGLTVLRELANQLPEYSYLYLGDNAREPYGGRDQDEIFEFTQQGVEYLFARGCPLVIVACNTSSANALRRIQQEVLPVKYPDRRVLGVLVPAVEEIAGVGWNGEGNDPASGGVNQYDRLTPVDPIQTVGIIGTPATTESKAYTREIKNRNDSIQVFEQACPNLAGLIADGAPEQEIRADVRSCLEQLNKQMSDPPPDAVLIGCTHYALIKDLIEDELRGNEPASGGVNQNNRLKSVNPVLIDQGPVTAERLKSYLEHHPEIQSQLDTSQTRRFLTTADPDKVSKLASKFYGQPIEFERINL